MTLWLVRHAAPSEHTGRCYGRTDLAADPHATADVARRLGAVLPAGTAVQASPRLRCQALAQALQQLRPDLGVRVDARLAEMDFGTWEGQHWDQLGAATLDAWTRDFWLHRPGGGESVSQVFARVGEAFDELQAQSAPVAWITHAGVIRTVQLLAQGVRRIDDAAAWPRVPIAFGAWQVLDT